MSARATRQHGDDSWHPRPVARLAYTVSEAARELRIGRTTIYRMIADKQLDTFTIRGMRRVAASEIDRIIKGEPRAEA